jgi:hypothetical protein
VLKTGAVHRLRVSKVISVISVEAQTGTYPGGGVLDSNNSSDGWVNYYRSDLWSAVAVPSKMQVFLQFRANYFLKTASALVRIGLPCFGCANPKENF